LSILNLTNEEVRLIIGSPGGTRYLNELPNLHMGGEACILGRREPFQWEEGLYSWKEGAVSMGGGCSRAPSTRV